MEGSGLLSFAGEILEQQQSIALACRNTCKTNKNFKRGRKKGSGFGGNGVVLGWCLVMF